MRTLFVTGGSGFVGRHLLAGIAAARVRGRAPLVVIAGGADRQAQRGQNGPQGKVMRVCAHRHGLLGQVEAQGFLRRDSSGSSLSNARVLSTWSGRSQARRA